MHGEPRRLRKVDCTGCCRGSAFVPAIRRRFEARFGLEKIVSGDEFVSVGSGLALLARERAQQPKK